MFDDVSISDTLPDLEPDFLVTFSGGQTPEQQQGFILMIVGVILFDVCPGVLFIILLRLDTQEKDVEAMMKVD